MEKKRVVVTGIGMITAIGDTTNSSWENLLGGVTRVNTIPDHWYNYADFISGIYSDLPEIDFKKSGVINRIEQKQLDYSGLMAINAAHEALSHAGLSIEQTDKKKNTYTTDFPDPNRARVYLGTGIGGLSTVSQCFSHQILARQKPELEALYANLKDNNDVSHEDVLRLENVISKMTKPIRFNPFAVSMIMPNAVSSNISIKFNLRGSNNTFCNACASGTVAIGHAYEAIKYGKADMVVTGGVEYLQDDYGALYYAFDCLKTLAAKFDDPDKANRPFDKNRSGFLYSQGACAVLILEEAEHAEKRGANIICELSGFNENSDAYNIIMINKEYGQIKRLIEELLQQENIKPADVDYINSHGTGTELNDEIESALIEEVFGNKVLVNSTKSILGHSLGASGAVEAAVTALSVKEQKAHASLNIENPVRDLNFIRESGSYQIKRAISQSFGFGGHNAALLFNEYN